MKVAELRGQCEASSTDRGLDAMRAHALCGCTVARLTELFPPSWFTDGRPMTREELGTVSNVYVSCAKKVSAQSNQAGASSL